MKTLVYRYQRDCVFQFLMGLHDIYSNICDQTMLLDPIPPVTKFFLSSNNKNVSTILFNITHPLTQWL